MVANFGRVAIDPSGRIVIASDDGSSSIHLYRYSDAGVLDGSYGAGGVATVTSTASPGFGSVSTNAQRLMLDASANAALLVRVTVPDFFFGSTTHALVARLGADGAPIAGFGTNGVVEPLFSGNENPFGLAFSGTGLIVGGNSNAGTFIARLDASGGLDTAFGPDGGVVTGTIPSDNTLYDLDVDPAGRIVASILTFDTSVGFAVARFLPTGTLDGTFGSGGVASVPLGGQCSFPLGVDVDPSGNVILGGQSSACQSLDVDLVVTRIAADQAPPVGDGSVPTEVGAPTVIPVDPSTFMSRVTVGFSNVTAPDLRAP